MLTAKYRRIYHYHLRKCGGTTLNRWLDTLTFDERSFNEPAWKASLFVETTSATGEVSETVPPACAKTVFHWSDVVHHHAPLRMYAPANTFCFTVLRDPVSRLISQVLDWRRLNASDTVSSPPDLRACIGDSGRLPLRDFLETHAHRGARRFLDNYLTRSLAAGRIGDQGSDAAEPEDLLEVALQSLEDDYDLIGLTAHLDLTRNALCAMVGLPPARTIPVLNVTRAAGPAGPELSGLSDVLADLTRVDRVICQRARQLFDQRHRRTAETYDTAAFETTHASRLLAEARGHYDAGATRFSVRAPIVGAGFHGRDGVRTPSCAVWSGPDTCTTLYIATPPRLPLSLLVWIRGYADSRQREQIRVRVDGRPVAHRFESAPGYADVLTVETFPAGDFVRLDIDIDETTGSGEPGSERHDPRERGFSFDGYGWRPIDFGALANASAVCPEAASEQVCQDMPDDVAALVREAETQPDDHCWRGKAILVARTVLRERPLLCVGIGAVGGGSLVACAAALRHIGDGAVYAVDTWDPAAAGGHQDPGDLPARTDAAATKRAFYRFVAARNLTRRVHMIEAPLARAAALFDEIDMLHIGAVDQAAHAPGDIEPYARKVRGGGVIMIDETSGRSSAPVVELLSAFCDTVTMPPQPEGSRNTVAVLRRR